MGETPGKGLKNALKGPSNGLEFGSKASQKAILSRTNLKETKN